MDHRGHGRFAFVGAQLADDRAARERLAERLTSVRASIADAEALLRSARVEELTLQAHLEEKDRSIARQTRLVSPVSALPPEMLAQIFQLVPTEPGLYHEDTATRVAFLVASVSRQWRQAALGCPRVWAEIYFDFTRLGPTVSAEARYAQSLPLRLQLHRAKSAPLDIRLFSYDPLRTDEDDYGSVLLQIAMKAPQWRSFAVTVSGFGTADSSILHHFLQPTPLLEEFSLHKHPQTAQRSAEHEQWNLDYKIPFLPHTPSLRKLSVHSFIVDHIVTTPRPSLTHAELTGWSDVSPDSVINLLDGADRLEELEICAWASNNQDSVPPRRAPQFGSLQKLYFRDCSADVLLPYIAMLSLPKLQYLGFGDYASMPEELAFLRTCANVRNLDIGYRGIPDTAGLVPAIFDLLPHLEELNLDHFWLAADDIQSLAQVDEATGLWRCPRLRSLGIGECHFVGDGIPQLFLEMVKARLAAHARDENVAKFEHIYFYEGDCPKWLATAVRGLVPPSGFFFG